MEGFIFEDYKEAIKLQQIINMTSIYSTYDQLAELIADVAPQKVLALKANPTVQLRFEELANKAKEGSILKEEKDELDHFIVLERLMRLAKIRAAH